MEQLPDYIKNFNLLKKIELLYNNQEERNNENILRFSRISPNAEKTLGFLKDKMYTKLLVRYTDALLFLEYSINNNIPLPLEMCKSAKLINDDINLILNKIKEKGFYKQIDSKFASRHFQKICLLDPENRTEILGGLTFVGIGLFAVTMGALKIFRGAYF
jgi:hypothetical protein